MNNNFNGGNNTGNNFTGNTLSNGICTKKNMKGTLSRTAIFSDGISDDLICCLDPIYNNNDNNNDAICDELGLTPIDNNTICSTDFTPINVMRTDPFRKKSTQELTREWTEWKENSPSLFTPAIVGVVTSFLLQSLKKQATSFLLKTLTDLLFPNNSSLTMEEILRATEQYVQERLDTDTANRVSQELVGLKNNLTTFNDQVEDFLQNRVGISPLAIIDSINTMQQLFVNRLPQFQVSGYQVLLLPLFAQAATLHLTFLRDVIINADEWNIPTAQLNTYTRYFKEYIAEYSNYALSTYDDGFRTRFYPRNTLEDMLQFKTFMTLNALDLVSIWSLLKYVNLYVSTSANLYNIGDNKVNEGAYPISYGPFFNSYIQTKSNYVLSGVSGIGARFTYSTVLGRYLHDDLKNIITTYVGGTQGPNIGVQLSTTELDELKKQQQATRDSLVDFQFFTLNCMLPNPITAPYFATSLYESRYSSIGGYLRKDVFKSEDSTCGLGNPGAWTSYPDYYITNISATVQINGENTDTTPLYFKENRPITSTRGVNKVIAVYNRKANIAGTNQNGTMIHQAPPDGTGFTVSPLHPSANTITSYIKENYGNSGDSLHLKGQGYLHYMLSGNGQDRYRLVLRLSGAANQIKLQSPTTSIYAFDTSTNNEGITDNGSKFKDFAFSTPFVIPEQKEIVLYFEGVGSLDLMNLIFLPADDTPLY
uniref:Parasporal crystal protein Cry18Aa n=1 Tax=Paenibacillus popilliae TaxID=78057 RepID=C18AA_PAEPP|nr:RecName: Full=Parasporal crystal protein Cry18Aa; AltName: Full=79 kDa crystal protein; AltName: Full=Crystaline parasporal protoxin; AltName: Full=Parasporal delta-endotoxin CryXVIIIA(a) [Paenibacillus popilliae]CAA67506.1 parasporal crystal protein [Paenibacillus popilliae]